MDFMLGWDPSETLATRPLVLKKNGQNSLFYTHEGNKNVSELVFSQQTNGIAAHYEYAPFGAITVTAYDFCESNPYRFSSEYADDTFELVYYNFRHCSVQLGNWLTRDPLFESGGVNMYSFVENASLHVIDILGGKCIVYVFIGHYPGMGAVQENHPDSILFKARNTIKNRDTSCDGILSLSCHMKTFLDAATKAFPRIKVPRNWPAKPYDDDRVTTISDFDVLISSGKFDEAIASVSSDISSDCCCEKITVKIKCDQQSIEGLETLSRPGVGNLRQDQNPCVNGGKEYVLPKNKK